MPMSLPALFLLQAAKMGHDYPLPPKSWFSRFSVFVLVVLLGAGLIAAIILIGRALAGKPKSRGSETPPES